MSHLSRLLPLSFLDVLGLRLVLQVINVEEVDLLLKLLDALIILLLRSRWVLFHSLHFCFE